jgi:bacterioferritin-associated ferredoxin
MYVCLCMGVSDQEIHEAIGAGACSVPEVMQCTGAGTRCGSCRKTIASLVGDEDTGGHRHLGLVRAQSAA